MKIPVRFRVHNLLSQEESRDVLFPVDEEFHIIYGPNGVGKTKWLEAVNALLCADLLKLSDLPLTGVSIDYSDGTTLAYRTSGDGMMFVLEVVEGDEVLFRSEQSREDLFDGRVIDVAGTEWVGVGSGYWRDPTDGETISDQEMRQRYGPLPDPEVRAPEGLGDIQELVRPMFIRTQRLLEQPHMQRTHRLGQAYPVRRRGRPSRNAVERYAEDIRSHLREALARNSRSTAQLDRTFPNRLLDNATDVEISEEEIRRRYETQSGKRERLARLSLIGGEPEIALPSQELIEWQRRVLRVYLEDTEKKLNTFDEVLERVELLEDVINRRFLGKAISVTADDGLKVTTDSGHEVELAELSSGEQHELIMFFDMLFNVQPGSLVLIDEPEISLHVGWQREFLNDMKRVSQLSSARVLIATHSPQIIGNWRSRSTSLAPDSEWSESV